MRRLKLFVMFFINPIQKAGARSILYVFPNTTPNLMCGFRICGAAVLFFALAAATALGPNPYIAAFALAVGVAAWYTDFFDGAVASIQEEQGWVKMEQKAEEALPWKARMYLGGKTWLGEWLDPWADKAMFLAAGLPLSVMAGFKLAMATALLNEVLLILVRPFKEHVLRVDDKSANIFGKIKSNVQPYALLIIFGLTLWPWFRNYAEAHTGYSSQKITDWLMILVVMTQLGSLLGHLWTGLRKKWGFDPLTEAA